MSHEDGYNVGQFTRSLLKEIYPLLKVDGGDPTIFTRSLFQNDRGGVDGSGWFQYAHANAFNGSGSAANVGLACRIPITLWKFGKLTAAGVFTDETTQAQQTTVNDCDLETTTINDGCLILCTIPFNMVVVNVTTAGVTGNAHDFSLTNGAGGFLSAATIIDGPTATVWPSGEQVVFFGNPGDIWGKTTGAEATNVPAGYYGLRIRNTVGGGTAALAGSLSVHRCYHGFQALGNGAAYDISPSRWLPLDTNCEAMFAYFSVASQKNRMTALVRTRG